MTTEPAKVYDPKSVEKEVYQRWIAAGAFDAEPGDAGRKYCIVIPPPNVTAVLHAGHALNNTLQDILIRTRRMQGYNTLWMPGTDHAGIATQAVVDKRLKAEGQPDLAEYRRMQSEGKDGRRLFVEKVQAWKDEYEARILDQLKMMGCSCDWRRTRFTMDETCARAVREAFFRLLSDGLIYRGKRLVNWDPVTQTVLADDEVEHEEVQGHFYYLKYPLTESVAVSNTVITHVTVATTRPETMLGDTAVAMNPRDPRAKYLVGKKVRLPIVGREIPIIADEHVVLSDPESEEVKARISTGFLKVTPAHDPDDYAIGQRHDLPVINVMAPDGTISDKHGWGDWEQVRKDVDGGPNSDLLNLIGLDRFEARQAVVEWFRTEDLLEKVIDYTHQVGHSYRSHVPIEPYLSDQWYVAVKEPIANCQLQIANCNSELLDERDGVKYIKGTDVPVNSLAGLALMPLLDGRLKFTPDRYANNYRSWLENLRDWPISRQLWWGHRIPVWNVVLEPYGDELNDSDRLRELPAEELYRSWFEQRLNELARQAGLEPNSFCSRSGRIFNEVYVCPHTTVANWLLEDIIEALGNLEARRVVPGQSTPLAISRLKRFPKATLESFSPVIRMIHSLNQDEDVLDTWFSSALWPFSTLGWPERTDALKTWYPGDVLCTAREIITLWVSRMVMMGQYCLGDIPFRDVFIHAMIQDGEGRKMSKSLGNGIDPLDIIDSHGADALRFTLTSMTTQTQDVRMPVEKLTLPDGREMLTSPKFDIGRNFANKLWNASRFAMMNLAGMPAWQEIQSQPDLSDAWILSRLGRTIRDATEAIDNYRFNELADTLYHFVWDDFCDWYLEIAKSRINAGASAPKAVLAHALDNILRLLHPVMPFVTEAIWRNLNAIAPCRGPGDQQAEGLLIKAAWPRADAAAIKPDAEEEFELIRELVRGIRNARTQHGVPPGKKVSAVVEATGQAAGIIAANADLLRSQGGLADFKLVESGAAQAAGPNAASVAAGGLRLYVMDIIDRGAELARLTKQADTLRKGIRSIEGKLGNEGFLAKAPPELVAKERKRLEGLQADLAAVEKSLEGLK